MDEKEVLDLELRAKLKEVKDDNDEKLGIVFEAGDIKSHGIGWRHVITLLVFFGFIVLYALRVNLSVGLVAMTNHSALLKLAQSDDLDANFSIDSSTSKENLMCGGNAANSTSKKKKPMKDGPFAWDENLQGVILASFFYGYIVTQIPGGFLAGRFGAKWVLGLGALWTAVLTLLTPTAAELGAGYLISLRILEGLGEGITWPAVQALFANWAPPSERSQLPAFAASGCLFGTLLAFVLSGFLAESEFLGGWPSVFYVFSFAGCVWFVFWAILASSSPESHKWISEEEKTYIVKSLKAEGQERLDFRDVQWGKIAKSLPLWAAMISHFTVNWCLYVLLTGLPIYFKDVLGFDVKSNGIASAMPYLCQGIVQAFSGKAADILRNQFKLSTTIVRKIFDCSGHLLPAIFVISVGFVGCNSNAALASLILAVGLSGLCGGGYIFNFLDLAPQMSGILFGVSNAFATIPGIIGPSVTGALIKGAVGPEIITAWRNVFFIAGVFYLFSTVFYFIFGKGDVQPWAKAKPKSGYIVGERV